MESRLAQDLTVTELWPTRIREEEDDRERAVCLSSSSLLFAMKGEGKEEKVWELGLSERRRA